MSVPSGFVDRDNGGAPCHGSLVRQKGYGGVSQHLEKSGLRLGPDAVGGTPALASAGVVAGEAQVEPDWPLDGLDHLQDRCGAMEFFEFEPAGVAAMGDDETGAGQILQHLTEELLGAFGGHGQFRTADPRAGRKAGQVNHHANGIVCGSSQLHTKVIRLYLSG